MSKLKRKEYKKLLKSIAKEWEKSGLLSEADLNSVAGGAPPFPDIAGWIGPYFKKGLEYVGDCGVPGTKLVSDAVDAGPKLVNKVVKARYNRGRNLVPPGMRWINKM